MTVFNWGEDPVGDWVLRVCNADNDHVATLEKVMITIYGVTSPNEPGDAKREDANPPPHEPTRNELNELIQSEEEEAENVKITSAEDDDRNTLDSNTNALNSDDLKDAAFDVLEQMLKSPLYSNRYQYQNPQKRNRQTPVSAYKRGYLENYQRAYDDNTDVTYDEVIEALRNVLKRSKH